jgi:uncharacterized spore protein YtfJ
MTTRDIFDRSADLITPKRVFGDPYTSDGVTVIPAASIRGAGGGGEGKRDAEQGDGGGFAVNARPAGVVEITGDTVRWKVPFDLNRAIAGTQLVVMAYLVLRWLTDRSKTRAVVKMARLSNSHASDLPAARWANFPDDGDPPGWTCTGSSSVPSYD